MMNSRSHSQRWCEIIFIIRIVSESASHKKSPVSSQLIQMGKPGVKKEYSLWRIHFSSHIFFR